MKKKSPKSIASSITEHVSSHIGDVLDRKLPAWLPFAAMGGFVLATAAYGIYKLKTRKQEISDIDPKMFLGLTGPCEEEKERWRPLYRPGIAKLKIHDMQSIKGKDKVYLRVVARNETDMDQRGAVLVKRFHRSEGPWTETVLHREEVVIPAKKDKVIVVPMVGLPENNDVQFAAVLRNEKNVIGFDCAKT